MIDPILLLAFLPAALALNLTPGPEMLFCLARGLEDGPITAALAAVGMAVGAATGVCIAGFGLAALLDHAPVAFDLIRWAGIVYLLYVAVRTLRKPLVTGTAPRARSAAARTIGGGYLVSLLNPKGAVFVLALLPQFMSPALPVGPQFAALGAVLVLSGLIVNLSVGLFAHRLRAVVLARPRLERAFRTVVAGLFGALAVRLVAEGRG